MSIPSKIYFTVLSLLVPALLFSGCSTSYPSKSPQADLVGVDDPIFDKRFHTLSLDDIDLEHFWTEGDDSKYRNEIVITNRTFVDLVEKVKGGVVNIYTRRLEMRETRFGFVPQDMPIKIPIISDIIEAIPFHVPIPYRSEGISLGSGFIINSHGFILTNAHVIHNATDISVVLAGGKLEYPAKIIGIDQMTDIALIKIDPDRKLTVLPLGNSDELQMGEAVIAIGNPLGFTHTVTSGLVSAKNRIVPQLKRQVLDFIQTDSAINPGSSGGPLLNLYGEVVGVNTAILTKAQLIGFAVPVNIVKEIMHMLVLGKVERGWFGVSIRPLVMRDYTDTGFPGEDGILILEVDKRSPAAKAGLKANDIITEINGWDIDSFFKFRRKLLTLAPEQDIHLSIFRDGKTFEVSSKLVHKPQKK